MTITPITQEHPACLGVMCPQRGQCARYHAVERLGSAHAISSCQEAKNWPLFVQHEAREVQA